MASFVVTHDGGNLTEYTGSVVGDGFTITAEADAAKDGSYGMRLVADHAVDSPDNGYYYKDLAVDNSAGDFGCQAWVRFHAWTSVGTEPRLLTLATWGDMLSYVITGERTVRPAFWGTVGGFQYLGTTTLQMTLDTWYLLRIRVTNRSDAALTCDLEFSYSTDGATFTTIESASGVGANAADAWGVFSTKVGWVKSPFWSKGQFTIDYDTVQGWEGPLPPGQQADPIADVTLGTWVNELGNQTNLYQSIDDGDTNNDADYIETPEIPTSDSYKCTLGDTIIAPEAGEVAIIIRGRFVDD